MTACRFTTEPLAGTAPCADVWWLVEDPGPWGSRAPGTSRLDGVRELTSSDERRVLLVRPTTRRASTEAGIVVWIAPGGGGPPIRYVADDPRDLPHWPVTGDPGALRAHDETDAPRLLVCTNSARDACCGVVGRQLLRAIGPRAGLWESSHLGGHRFAPTALQIIHGMVYGRLTADAAVVALTDDEPNPSLTDFMRGAPAFDAVRQVADIAVLGYAGQRALALLANDQQVRAGLPDGQTLTVTPRTIDIPSRPASCGADPTPARVVEAVNIA